MAYDAATKTMLMFGGLGGPGYLGDTWSWNGITWTRLSPSARPPARSFAPMAYDAATKTVLLFGGEGLQYEEGNDSAYGGISDTWSWNGTTWTELSPSTSPGPGEAGEQSMAYDPATGTVLLFTGCCSTPGQSQTWSWSGTTWTRLSPPKSPPAGDNSSMTYDAATATVLLLLGSGQTWNWNGTTWIRSSPPTSPPVGSGWSMDYDPATATVLLFGGTGSARTPAGAASPIAVLDETWSWNGAAWTKLSPATNPGPRAGASMAYDPDTKAILLFGDEYEFKNDETWTLTGPSSFINTASDAKAWAGFPRYGVECQLPSVHPTFLTGPGGIQAHHGEVDARRTLPRPQPRYRAIA